MAAQKVSLRKKRLVEHRDYFCGRCAGRRRVYCSDCIEGGCGHCSGGFVKCPACKGGEVPQPPPDWI